MGEKCTQMCFRVLFRLSGSNLNIEPISESRYFPDGILYGHEKDD